MTAIANGNANGKTKSYSANLNLVAGDNLITHNLGLASPFFLIVGASDVTGSQILLIVKDNTANTCIIRTATNINNVNLKLL